MDDVTFTDFDDEIDFDDGDEAETSKAKPKKKATRKKAAKSSSRKSTKAAGKATKTTRRKASAAKTEASVEDDGTGFGDDTDEADERPARKPAKKTARKTTARKSTRKKSTSEYDGEAPAEVVEAFSAEELEAELARRKAARNGDAGTASSRDDDIDFDDDEPAPKAERKRSVRSRKAPRDEFDFDDNSNDDSNANADEDTADKSSASSRSRGGRRGRRSETTSQDETDLNSDTISNDQTGDTTGDQADDDTFGDDADASGSRSRSRRSRRGDRDGSRESSSRDRVDASDDDIDFDDPDDGESSGGRSSRIRSGSSSRSSDKRDGQRDDQRDDRRDDNRPARSRSDQDDGDQPRRRRRRRGRRGRGGDGDTQTREGGSQQGGHNSSTQRGQNDRDQGSRSKRGRRGRGGKKPQGGGYSGQPHVSGDYSDASGACDGVLEMHPKGYGFLRSKENDFAAQEPDPFVSTQFIEKYCLREGVFITGELGPGHRNQGPRVREIETIEGMPAEDYCDVQDFDKLTPVNPFEQIKLETGPSPVTMRIVDLLAPIGKGQRALIVAPPRSGKTILLQQIADSVAHNHPECHLMVLLIDERPEEVTEMRRHVKGEVIASTLDNNLENHVRVSQLVVERAKRLAERGEDVFLLLDSITRTARAFNKYSNNGPTGSGGMGVRAMEIPKKLFGTARRFDEGGSVTVVGTALIETGGRIDDVIFQEFKGTGNMELVLSRDLADRRIFPAIDISKTGTRREELLLDPEVLEGVNLMRRSLLSLHPVEAMEQLIRTLAKFNTNDEFLEKIRSVM